MNSCLFNSCLLYTFVLTVTINLPCCGPMPHSYQATPAIQLLSALTFLERESDALRASKESGRVLVKRSSTIHPFRIHRDYVILPRRRRLAENEAFGFRIHKKVSKQNVTPNNRTSISSSNNSQTETNTLLILPPFFPNISYPIFRFYSPVAQAYLTASEENSLITAKINNPFSKLIEWEWISVPTYSSAYLRHAHSQRYLCFNENGRPTLLKNIYFPRCLLQINAFVNVSSTFLHTLSRKRWVSRNPENFIRLRSSSPQPGTRLTATKYSNNKTASVSATQRDLSKIWSPRTVRHSVPLTFPMYNAAVDTSNFRPHSVRQRQLIVRVPRPQLVWISTAAHLPPWKVQFCANGQPFAHRKLRHSRCSIIHLPRLSGVFVLQPQISHACIAACRAAEEHSLTSSTGRTRSCPKECLRDSPSPSGSRISRVKFPGSPNLPKSKQRTTGG